jgi:hypothetical protein
MFWIALSLYASSVFSSVGFVVSLNPPNSSGVTTLGVGSLG